MGENVVVIGQVRDQSKGAFHVHAADCADCAKSHYAGLIHPGDYIEAASRREVVEFVYPPSDFEYDPETELGIYEGDIHFFPCVKSLSKGGEA